MKFDSLKKDKGVAGLTILLSLVTMLFVIGLLVMIFSLMGGELKNTDSALTQHTSPSTAQTGITLQELGVNLTTCRTAPNGAILTLTAVNDSGGFTLVAGTDYTTSSCEIVTVGTSTYNSSLINVTYTYTYSGSAYDVMNDSVEGIGGVTDWFDIFLVIGAMVVLILLTVIIITAIRGSGMMGGETSQAGGNVGYA